MKDIFFQLLRIGLWSDVGTDKDELLPELSIDDWNSLFLYATKQTVEGVFFDALQILNQESIPPENILIKWTVRIDQIENRNKKINSLIANQWRWFKNNNLNPIMLKGQGVAQHYASPLRRGTGDIDWFFDSKSYGRVLGLLRKKGIVLDIEGFYDISYTSDSIIVEHHRKLFDMENPFKKKVLNKLLSTRKDALGSINIDSEEITILSPVLQLVQVNLHILKHQLGFGIGVRQLCDSARLYHSYKDKYDSEELMMIYKSLGILKWIHVLHHVLVTAFGLSEDKLPFGIPKGIDSSWMLEEVWQSGTFGYYDERYKNGKIFFLSAQSDPINRIFKSFKFYSRLVPFEAVSYVLNRIFLKFFLKKNL